MVKKLPTGDPLTAFGMEMCPLWPTCSFLAYGYGMLEQNFKYWRFHIKDYIRESGFPNSFEKGKFFSSAHITCCQTLTAAEKQLPPSTPQTQALLPGVSRTLNISCHLRSCLCSFCCYFLMREKATAISKSKRTTYFCRMQPASVIHATFRSLWALRDS